MKLAKAVMKRFAKVMLMACIHDLFVTCEWSVCVAAGGCVLVLFA